MAGCFGWGWHFAGTSGALCSPSHQAPPSSQLAPLVEGAFDERGVQQQMDQEMCLTKPLGILVRGTAALEQCSTTMNALMANS